MAEVQANKVAVGELKNPGDYYLTVSGMPEGVSPPSGIGFMCPCGCGDASWVAFEGRYEWVGPQWKWNGSEDKPTLTPSLKKLGGCKWHGYLTDGVFRSC